MLVPALEAEGRKHILFLSLSVLPVLPEGRKNVLFLALLFLEKKVELSQLAVLLLLV